MGVKMLKPDSLFSGPILDMASYGRLVDAFATSSNYYYHGWDLNGVDLYPNYPLCVESDQGSQLVWMLGMVIGNRPGKALLVGVTKVRGFKDNIHSAFEVLPGIPANMDESARQIVLKSLRKRMRSAIILLAKRADLVSYNDSREYSNEFLSALSHPPSECAAERRPD